MFQSIFLSLGDAGTAGPAGPPGPSSASPTTLNADSLMSLFSTSTQMANLFNISSDRSKHFDFVNRFKTNENPIETASRFLDNLTDISHKITLKTKPDGSRMYPTRSCRDLADYYPEKPNG